MKVESVELGFVLQTIGASYHLTADYFTGCEAKIEAYVLSVVSKSTTDDKNSP